jgi:plastocyanin
VNVFSLAFLIGVLTATSISRAADIIGTINLTGTPPAEIPYTQLMEDSTCGQMYNNAPTTHFYVVGKNGEFGDITVYLKDASGNDITGKSTGASAPAVVLDQKGCLYTPQIFAIQTGQKVTVRNSDQCVHNVDVVSKVIGHTPEGKPITENAQHNDGQMPGAADLHYTFDKPEMFLKFQCDVHPWMFAWASVFDNPYFAISGADGKFVIKNVPPGKYTLVAAHRKLGEQTQAIEVTDKDVTQNFTFAVK